MRLRRSYSGEMEEDEDDEPPPRAGGGGSRLASRFRQETEAGSNSRLQRRRAASFSSARGGQGGLLDARKAAEAIALRRPDLAALHGLTPPPILVPATAALAGHPTTAVRPGTATASQHAPIIDAAALLAHGPRGGSDDAIATSDLGSSRMRQRHADMSNNRLQQRRPSFFKHERGPMVAAAPDLASLS